MKLLDLLVKKGVLKEKDVSQVQKEAREKNVSVSSILARRGISKEDILAAEGAFYNMPTRDLSGTTVENSVLSYIPEESARHYKLIPIAVADDVLEVGIVDPDNIEALDALNFISTRIKMPYKLFLIGKSDFDKTIEQYQSLTGEVGAALTELETALVTERTGPQNGAQSSKEEVQTIIKEDAPVTKIVATILRYAVEGGASDIHIEPTREKVRIRFRMDGDLHTSLELPTKVHRAVVARIKILASIKLDEKRKPQDGRFSAKVEDRNIDFRVSTFPTFYGEKVVMRILDRSSGQLTLEDLGFEKRNLDIVRKITQQPYGMILISGPTGSGKSTTLYSMLREIDREKHNVVSLEDPIEYDITGVSQSQMRPEIGYTFASGLRSILRQDPDIIMVGEIRDKETAQLAIQAALTGHLVFSTIHTNTAVGAIPRLINMGIDPYLIAPTLVAVIGQRLIRKMCPGAGRKIPVEGSLKVMLDKQFEDLPEEYRKKYVPEKKFMYGVAPAPGCPNGTRGRLGVFEMLQIDEDIERIILDDATEEKIFAAARAKGMLTMKEDAIIKGLKGVVPFEEVNTLGGDSLVET
ncbi:type II/IV secretion system protein [Candidatus Wolfebacteria bacterium]|nr:type II/IV secretion system protein [Candidatus Wolfebacteria bacterium]